VTGPGRKLGLAAVLVVVLSALLSACFPRTPLFTGSNPVEPLVHATLIGDGNDTYRYTRGLNSLVVTAPHSNTGGELRQVFYPANGHVTTDEQSCSTWVSQTGAYDQQGIALRIAHNPGGHGIRAITVTKNIWYIGYWQFNVHVWNSASAQPFTQLATVDMASVVGSNMYQLVPLPWHVCARVSGLTFEFVVWTGSHPQPRWDDPHAVKRVALPAGWDYPGKAGWYIGHVTRGNTDRFRDLQTWSLPSTAPGARGTEPTLTTRP
jgi:hypothetical protein